MARTGRPRGFDKDEALDQAMRLFWAHGYEATSLSQLKAAMGGISASSFFAAFGSKEFLFRAALDRYAQTHGRSTEPLHDLALRPRDAVEQALRASARMQTDPTHPPGCFVVLSTAACAPENRHLQAMLAAARQRTRDGIRACVQRAVEADQLQAGTDVTALATVLDTVLVGLATQARDGVPLSALEAGITAVMSAWDIHATAAPSASVTRPKGRPAEKSFIPISC